MHGFAAHGVSLQKGMVDGSSLAADWPVGVVVGQKPPLLPRDRRNTFSFHSKKSHEQHVPMSKFIRIQNDLQIRINRALIFRRSHNEPARCGV